MGLSGWWSAYALLWGGLMLAQESSAESRGNICIKWTKIQVLDSPKTKFYVELEQGGHTKKWTPKSGSFTYDGYHNEPLGEKWCQPWSSSSEKGRIYYHAGVDTPDGAAEINLKNLPSASDLAGLKCGEKKLVEVTSPYPQDLEECEGNCMKDTDCARNLQCFYWPTGSPVPGCPGRRVNDYGYCIKPILHLRPSGDRRRKGRSKWKPKKPSKEDKWSNPNYPWPKKLYRVRGKRSEDERQKLTGKLRECEGACNKNSDCLGGLLCSKRDVNPHEPIPGCLGPAMAGTEFCYRPRAMQFLEKTPRYGLGECQGDCDSDADCAGTMKCFQRDDPLTPTPGCKGLVADRYDYCYSTNGQYERQDLLAECKAQSQWSKYKNGCEVYAVGWKKQDNHCHDCSSTRRAFSRQRIGECVALCEELYREAKGESSMKTCISGCDWFHNRVIGKYERQDLLAECKAQSRWSKYKNGCEVYAEGWKMQENDCHDCSSTERVFYSQDLSECEALCENLYRRAEIKSSKSTCKSGCRWFHNRVTDTGFFNEKNRKGCQAVKYYGVRANYYLDMYAECRVGYYGKDCVKCPCDLKYCDYGIDGTGCSDKPYMTYLQRGSTGNPTYFESTGGLELCEGDCDKDWDCDGDLKCGQRNFWEDLPGCLQRGNSPNADHCYQP